MIRFFGRLDAPVEPGAEIILQVGRPFRFTAAVDQARAPHVTVGHLVAAQINWMLAGQLRVNALIQFAIAGTASIQRFKPAVILRQFLLDDVRLNRHPQMICLPGQVR